MLRECDGLEAMISVRSSSVSDSSQWMIEWQRAKELLESLIIVQGEKKEKKQQRDKTSRGNSLTVGQWKRHKEAGERATGVLVDDGLLDALKTSIFSALLGEFGLVLGCIGHFLVMQVDVSKESLSTRVVQHMLFPKRIR
jgi:hypothetical protein